MLAIRLTRTGKKHDPHYRIVVQEKRSKLNGGALEIVGHYHPASKDKLAVVNAERVLYWVSKGAQASDTVTNILVKQGIFDISKRKHHFFTPTKVEAPVVVEAAPVVEETPAPAVEEAPMEEVVTEAPATEEVVAEEAPAAEAEVAEVAAEAEAPATEEEVAPAKEA